MITTFSLRATEEVQNGKQVLNIVLYLFKGWKGGRCREG